MRRVFVKVVVAGAITASAIVGVAGQASAKPILRWEKLGVPIVDEIGQSTFVYVNARIDRLPRQ